MSKAPVPPREHGRFPYSPIIDRPPLRWHAADYVQQGHSWWGNPPPESFGATQPLVGDWIAGALV